MKRFLDNMIEDFNGTFKRNTITMDVPLFIRLLEWAREDAKTDVELHVTAEKAVESSLRSGKVLCMADYAKLVGK